MKNCLFCKHFAYYSATRGYSEYTPGDTGNIGCGHKNEYWYWDSYAFVTEEEFRNYMLMANTCADYEEQDSGSEVQQ